tara:strand:- start:12 stop:206 length:195 start_codon:yes stop_codon:yes gene_type:complete
LVLHNLGIYLLQILDIMLVVEAVELITVFPLVLEELVVVETEKIVVVVQQMEPRIVVVVAEVLV